jgi:hypothetical protein
MIILPEKTLFSAPVLHNGLGGSPQDVVAEIGHDVSEEAGKSWLIILVINVW